MIRRIRMADYIRVSRATESSHSMRQGVRSMRGNKDGWVYGALEGGLFVL